MAKIIVVGSSNTDMVITTPKIPIPGETIMGNEFTIHPGGKGANQAVSAARAAQQALECIVWAKYGLQSALNGKCLIDMETSWRVSSNSSNCFSIL